MFSFSTEKIISARISEGTGHKYRFSRERYLDPSSRLLQCDLREIFLFGLEPRSNVVRGWWFRLTVGRRWKGRHRRVSVHSTLLNSTLFTTAARSNSYLPATAADTAALPLNLGSTVYNHRPVGAYVLFTETSHFIPTHSSPASLCVERNLSAK